MEPASPARLYASAAGAGLLVLGILGFFYSASFDGLGQYEDGLAGLQINGWLNLFYVATGAIGLLVAGATSRAYSLAMGLLCTALAIIGWGSEWLQLAIGLLGFAAVAGTPRPGRKPRRLKPRAKPAGKRA
jgi:hypothetical protein